MKLGLVSSQCEKSEENANNAFFISIKTILNLVTTQCKGVWMFSLVFNVSIELHKCDFVFNLPQRNEFSVTICQWGWDLSFRISECSPNHKRKHHWVILPAYSKQMKFRYKELRQWLLALPQSWWCSTLEQRWSRPVYCCWSTSADRTVMSGKTVL